MKVAILTESEAWGGLESHAVALATELVNLGHSASIVCLGAAGRSLYAAATPPQVSLLEIPFAPRRTARQWQRALAHLSCHAVVFEKGTLHSGSLGLDLVLRLKCRRYLTIQQLEPPVIPAPVPRRKRSGFLTGMGLWRHRLRLSGFLRSLAPHLTVGVSRAVSRRLIDDYGFSEKRVVTVHNGVDPDKFKPDPGLKTEVKGRWNCPADAIVLGSVGRLSDQKGLDIAVDAFSKVVSDDPDRPLYLVLVGEGPRRVTLEQQCERLGIGHRVRFPGFSRDPASSYQGIDIFLMPSRHEGLPFSMLEALASGCQVIATPVGGISEVVTDPAVATLVPPEDADALAAAMRQTLDRSLAERTAAIAVARNHVATYFNIHQQCRAIVDLLQPDPVTRGTNATAGAV